MNHATFSGTGRHIGQPRNLNIFSHKHKNAEISAAAHAEKKQFTYRNQCTQQTMALAMLKQNSFLFDKQ